MTYLVDTDVLIDYFRNTKNKKHFRNIEGLDLEVPEY
jgi:predicted nucleic acid-binding protein